MEQQGYVRVAIKKQVYKVIGLDTASPTGTALVTIADFTGAADQNLSVNPAALPLTEWILRGDSQANGTSWTLLRPGQYTFLLHIANAGATRLMAGLLRGSAAPPADPLMSVAGGRVVMNFDVLGAAAGSFDKVTLAAPVDVADLDIDGNNNFFRLQLSNAAGAAPAGLTIAEVGITIVKGAQVQSIN